MDASTTLPTGTVTFLFTDIEGSTHLWEQHPDAMRLALARHDALLRAAIETQGGSVFKTIGDQFCAAFATATDALDAALAAQQGFRTAQISATAARGGLELRVRMVLHTGVAELREGDYFGPALNRVARLLAIAHGGQVLLSGATQELVQDDLPPAASLWDLGLHRLQNLERPEQVFQFLHPDLPADFPALKSLDVHPNNLPVQLTPLVGREPEVAAVRELFRRADVALVTLTGPGGTGKTRLGLQIAADLLVAFEEGVFLVQLAPITDPDRVASTIAQTLGLQEVGSTPPLESLKGYLRQKQLLLLLDNFEQILSAAPVVAELLAAAPRLKVLVTSRAGLRLRGEHEFPVPPLASPDPRRLLPVEALSQYSAVELFVQRATAAKPDFTVTNENAPAVAQICYRLDGLPLAIELAAVRVKLFRAEALLSRLENRLTLLTGGARDLPARQQTLRGAIAWSYDLLAVEEQTLFRRLSVFVGGFTLEAAEAVCYAEGDLGMDPVDGITSLVDKSLLRRDEAAGEPRFGMLETIREYGRERLAQSGEAERLRERHASFFVELAERAEPLLGFGGPHEGTWLQRLEAEHDNLRGALDGAVATGQAEVGLRLAGALQPFWMRQGHMEEGRQRLEAALALPGASEPTTHRAKALRAAGWHAFHQNESAKLPFLEESLAIERQLGNKRGVAASLFHLGPVACDRGDREEARRFLEESLALYREMGDPSRIAWCLENLGAAQNDPEQGRALLNESMAMQRKLGNRLSLAWSSWQLGHLAWRQGDRETALRCYREGLALHRELNHKYGVAIALMSLGNCLIAQRDWVSARSALEEAQAFFQEIGKKGNRINSLLGLGTAAYHQQEFEQASRIYREALTLSQEYDSQRLIVRGLEGSAHVARAQERPARAIRLFAAAQRVREEIGDSWHNAPPEARAEHHDAFTTAARAQVGEEAFAAAWEAGRAMSLDEAVRVALGECEIPTAGKKGS